MEQVKCDAKVRTAHGKGAARKLRVKGQIPAVVYHRGEATVSLTVDGKDLAHVLSTKAGRNAIVALKIADNGKTRDLMAMVADVQRDTFQKSVLHVDFIRINMDEMVNSTVRIAFQGHAKVEEEGGMVEHSRNSIDVESLPANVPEQIDVDVSGLTLGHAIHVRDLKLPPGVTARTGGDEIVAVAHAARAAAEAPAAEQDTTLGAAAATPAT